jgi:hypothetical protein
MPGRSRLGDGIFGQSLGVHRGQRPWPETKAATLVETVRHLTLNEREQAHLAALSHLVQGARAAAVAVLDRHLMHYPFDLVAHKARH